MNQPSLQFMKYYVLFLSFFLGVNTALVSQTFEKSEWTKHNIYFEVAYGVVSDHKSINYERILLRSSSNRIHLFGRVGTGKFSVQDEPDGWGGLASLTLLTGKGNHHIEFAGGVVIDFIKHSEENPKFTLPLVDIGYRYQKPNGFMILRTKVGLLGIGFGFGFTF